MKNLKSFSILVLFLAMLSCKKDDDGGTVAEASFSAIINGDSFTNYSSALGFYDAESTNNNLTIAVTDANNNVIRLFMNSTGGFGSGVIKEIGNIDANNFSTTVVIRDQAAMKTYNSTDGSITISESNVSPEDSDVQVVSGNFTIIASTNIGPPVTMTGTFSNIQYNR